MQIVKKKKRAHLILESIVVHFFIWISKRMRSKGTLSKWKNKKQSTNFWAHLNNLASCLLSSHFFLLINIKETTYWMIILMINSNKMKHGLLLNLVINLNSSLTRLKWNQKFPLSKVIWLDNMKDGSVLKRWVKM